MVSLPWWIYLILAGIAFSGYMTIRTAKEEKEIDQSFIEREGEIYIERMNLEKERRKKSLQS